MTNDKTIEEVVNFKRNFGGVDEKLNALRKSSMDYLYNAFKDLK